MAKKVTRDHIYRVIKENAIWLEKIKEYIISTPNWIFYFIYNREIIELLREYPGNWEERIDEVSINYLHGSTVSITIVFTEYTFDNSTSDKFSFKRYINLPEFEETVYKYYSETRGNVDVWKIKELTQELNYHKSQAERLEGEIKYIESLGNGKSEKIK